ncbi:MAG: 16S rRNA (guanine(527)-N(7))-methyltransferase RsmG [Candidatus Sumerlaeota bacterium]
MRDAAKTPQTPLLDALPDAVRQRLAHFEEMIRHDSRALNLTRITEPGAVRLRHFEDALSALEILDDALPVAPQIVDVGSGAGVPGLVLAIARPHWRIVSVEATGKKTDFQQRVVKTLELGNVEVLNDRAEVLGRDDSLRENFDAALARALALLPELAELCLPLVKSGGLLLCWKSRDLGDEMEAGQRAVKALGGRFNQAHQYTLTKFAAEDPRMFQLINILKETPTGERYPRRYNAISKRPLGREKKENQHD